MTTQTTARDRGYSKGYNTTINRIRENHLTDEMVVDAFWALSNTPVPAKGYEAGIHEGTWDALKEVMERDSESESTH